MEFIMIERTLTQQIAEKIGQSVRLEGWVVARRDHGKVTFLDLRDRSGLVQLVGYKMEHVPGLFDVIEVQGLVKERPATMVNPELPNGLIEIDIQELFTLNASAPSPLDIDGEGYEINEERRLKYRYIDLRRERLNTNLKLRSAVTRFIRDFLYKRDFTEVETPNLMRSTPEGARDYVVPARLSPGKFYALPQSPQQFKQLLMVAGLERYFQIARCFRDEDGRGDRQPEFTQLDIEMSFVTEEDIMQLNEQLLIELVKKLAPEKKIQQIPFPRITYKESMEKYGNDRPDIRENKDDPNLLAFCWVVDFPFFEKTDEGGWTFTHNPFSAPQQQDKELLMNKERIDEIVAAQYDIVLNGYEIGGGGIRNHKPEALRKVFEIMGYTADRIEQNFGHMLEALSYGAPPHGGIAWGLDRFMSLLAGEPNIREVIAFPKTGEGKDPMMGAPTEIEDKQLKELHIESTV
jgi:aspartyl-tRNA synthetase